jgi:GPH family glycoside/pentoside/hexuronide:cation symporter
MAAEKHHTKPEDRLSVGQKLAYSLGAIANNLLGGAIGFMSIILNVGLGMNPALVGTLQAVPRFTDAFTDPLMGYISDNTRSRFGRRRPFVVVGAILVGIIFALMWQLPEGRSESFYFWVFLGSSIAFYACYTVFATPWVALGYEMTPDYHERTRLMAWQTFLGQAAWVTLPWFYAIMENDRLFDNSVEGARFLAIALGLFVAVIGVIPGIVCKERFEHPPLDDSESTASRLAKLKASLADFFKGFAITLKRRDFVKLCGGTFLLFNGIMIVGSFGSYITIFYVCGGNQDQGAKWIGVLGTVNTACTLAAIFVVTWLATHFGKRRTFMITTAVAVLASIIKWFCYDPMAPWKLLIPAPLAAFGGGALFTLMGAMIADVCDLDEVETGQRREGMYGSIYWWMIKLGMALAFALSGYLLNATGFDVRWGGAQTSQTFMAMRIVDVAIPTVTAALSILIVSRYSITETRAHEIRAELEARKAGKVSEKAKSED